MPIEIRELTIKTEIISPAGSRRTAHDAQELKALKRELMDACKRLIAQANKKAVNKR